MAGNITAGVAHAFRTVLLNICEEIYSLMIFCFEIFEQFGKLRVLENQVGFIFQKVSFVLGLFMVFRLSFAAIEYVINPDNMLDKTKGIGNIVKKVLIVIVLLGSTHFLFDFAYEANNALIDNQIIGKLLLSTPDSEYQSDGSEIAWNIFNAFFTINYDAGIEKGSDAANCIQYFEDDTFRTDLVEYHNMSHAFGCVNITDGEDNGWTFIRDESLQGNYIVNFHGILALAAGLVMLWIIVLYTIQLGIRAIQLAYLELIAPIPIMMYLMPKGEDKLGKWGQQCLTTFLDFFIRLAIIDFIVLLSSELIKSMTDESGEFFATFAEVTTNWAGTTYILVVMIVALFMFARRIPKLLGEIFPTMGGAASLGFGIGIPNELRQVGRFARGAATFGVGAVTGAVAGGVVGGINADGGFWHRTAGILTGVGRGARGGANAQGNIFTNVGQGLQNQRAAAQRAHQRRTDGSTFWGRLPILSTIESQRHQQFENELQSYDNFGDVRQRIDDIVNRNALVVQAEDDLNKLRTTGRTMRAITINGRHYGIGQRVSRVDMVDAIAEANTNIDTQRQVALENEIAAGHLANELNDAERLRLAGNAAGYAGYGADSITGAATPADQARILNNNRASTRAETDSIRNPGGARHAEYVRTGGNASYAPGNNNGNH